MPSQVPPRYMEDYVDDDGPAPSRAAMLTGRSAFNYELEEHSGGSDDEGQGRRR